MKRALILTFAVVLFLCVIAPTRLSAEVDFSKGMIDHKTATAACMKVTREKYPNADEVIVDQMAWIRYKADGTHVQWVEQYTKILTEKSRRANATLSSYFTIPYQRGPEDCNVPLVEIIKSDGKVVVIDVEKNSKLMINPASMGANIYNPNDKVIRINIPGLEIGDVLHFIMYDRVVQPRIKKTFCDWHGFEGTRPIVRTVVEIRAPKDLPLQCIVLKDPVGNTLKTSKQTGKTGGTVHRWEARDVPRMFPEPDMPRASMVTQRVLVSTAPDWQSISRWYWKLSEPHFKHTPGIKAKVDELTRGLEQPSEKITAIFNWVSQKIRYMGITAEAEAPGYEPHDVKDTFRQKHGVCRDKAALLVVMLRLAGFDAFPVLIHNGAKKDTEVPQPYFNHAISAVRGKNGTYMLMDATDESTRRLLPAYLNNKSYLVATPEGDTLRTSDIVPAEKNMMRIRTTAVVDADGNLKAKTTLAFDGINDNIYRGYFARSKPEVRRRYFEGAVQKAAAGARLTRCDITPADMLDTRTPLSVVLEFEAPDVLIRGGGHVMVPVPALGQRIGMANFILGRTGLRKRRYPLMTKIACGVDEKLEVKLDPSIGKVKLLPACEGVDDDTVSWKLAFDREGDVLKAEGDFRLKVVEFSPEQYLALKKTLKKIELDLSRMPIFRETATADDGAVPQGDVHVIDMNMEYRLADARNWTVTQSVKFKVLTYAGKKRYSELKLGYNPAWELIKLEKATVTAPDGKTREISKKEINIMDVASTAPRYPVAKTFVASLPGVEIGSIVEYRIVSTATNHPFFAMRESFQGFNAIAKKTVTVLAPPGVVLRRKILNPGAAVVTERRIVRPGVTGFEWLATDVPAVKREDDLPPRYAYTPTVFVTTGSLPAYAAEVYAVLMRNAVGQPAVALKAQQLVAAEPDPMKRLRVLRDFVAVNIRAAGPGLSGMPLSNVTAADRTLREGYGNTTDRAVLLYAMLNAVGMQGEFVLASTASRVESLRAPVLRYPHIGLFGSVLVRVRIGGETVYLNDTDQYAALGVTPRDGQPGLVLPAGNVEIIRAAPDRRNRREVTYAIKLDANGDALIKRTERSYGDIFGLRNRRYTEMRPEDRRRHFLELIGGIAQNAEAVGDLTTDFAGYPGVEAFTVKVKDCAIRDGEYLYFAVPESLKGTFGLRSDTRENALYLPIPRHARLNIHVLFPAEFKPVMLPPNVTWKSAYGSVSVVSTVAPEVPGKAGRALSIASEARIDAAVVSPDDYVDLFELNRKISHNAGRMILLRKQQVPAAVLK